MGDFNFNAPQYVDFTSPEALELRDYGDEYFDMDHEIEILCQEEVCLQEEQVIEIEDNSEDYFQAQDEADAEKEMPKLRRSVSASHILDNNIKPQDEACELSPALEALQLSETKNNSNKVQNVILPSKCNLLGSKSNSNSTTKLNKPLHNRPRAVSRDAINKIGLNKNDQLKRKMSVENLQPNKYISLAESVNKFQFGTPLRYHSRSSKIQFNNTKATALSCTIPQSPMLSTKARSRAPTCVSRHEQEKLDAEEMKKHQIKAHAINYKIFQAPILNAKVEKKPNTVPQPFNFTKIQFQKPPQELKPEIYEFHARPAPKTTNVTTKVINTRKSVAPTIVKTASNLMRKHRETLSSTNDNVKIKRVDMYEGVMKNIQKCSKTPVKTKVEPFSFEQRDRMMQQRKEEKIRKFLEEEKKAREFHARPILSKIACGSGQVESKISKILHNGSNSSLNSLKNDENQEPNQVLFKAKPATVIHKKPFIPKKEERPLLEISEFQLNTNKRAKEREEFDRKLKEKEEEFEKMKREQEEKLKQVEIDEIHKLRKETVHKANPIKHYKPLEIHPSDKQVTSPISPMITKKRSSRIEN